MLFFVPDFRALIINTLFLCLIVLIKFPYRHLFIYSYAEVHLSSKYANQKLMYSYWIKSKSSAFLISPLGENVYSIDTIVELFMNFYNSVSWAVFDRMFCHI